MAAARWYVGVEEMYRGRWWRYEGVGLAAAGRGRGRRERATSLCRLLPALKLDMMHTAIVDKALGVSLQTRRTFAKEMSANGTRSECHSDLGPALSGGRTLHPPYTTFLLVYDYILNYRAPTWR